MPILKIMVPLRAGSPFQEIPNHCPRRVMYRTATLTGRPRILPEHAARNPRALALGDFATEVMDLLSANPTPHEILVKGVLMHRWAERDGTYDNLVAQRSQALAMLPGRASHEGQRAGQ
jgi:hypothetical protein